LSRTSAIGRNRALEPLKELHSEHEHHCQSKPSAD
jgi:hypothetical protein